MMALCVVVDFCEEICLSGDVNPLRFCGRVNGDGDDAEGFAVFGVEFCAEVLYGSWDRQGLFHGFGVTVHDILQECGGLQDGVFDRFTLICGGEIDKACPEAAFLRGVDRQKVNQFLVSGVCFIAMSFPC